MKAAKMQLLIDYKEPTVPDLDWSDLRHALAIGRAGTLAGAARQLGVNATTVQRRL